MIFRDRFKRPSVLYYIKFIGLDVSLNVQEKALRAMFKVLRTQKPLKSIINLPEEIEVRGRKAGAGL
jgi:hypothetical protein